MLQCVATCCSVLRCVAMCTHRCHIEIFESQSIHFQKAAKKIKMKTSGRSNSPVFKSFRFLSCIREGKSQILRFQERNKFSFSTTQLIFFSFAVIVNVFSSSNCNVFCFCVVSHSNMTLLFFSTRHHIFNIFCRNALQCNATHCSALQHATTHCNTLTKQCWNPGKPLMHQFPTHNIVALRCSELQCVTIHVRSVTCWNSGRPLMRSYPASTVLRCNAMRCIVNSAFPCSALQCVAVRCSALQCVAVRCSALQCVAVRCSESQRGAVCCSSLQCVVVGCSALYSCSRRVVGLFSLFKFRKAIDMVVTHTRPCCSALQRIPVCCSMLQCVAVRCSALPSKFVVSWLCLFIGFILERS